MIAGARRDVPLAPLTTFSVGGPATFFVAVDGEARLGEALAFARSEGLAVFVLGGGSNLLVSDRGFRGLVVTLETSGIDASIVEDEAIVRVDAGVVWDSFVERCVHEGWAGVECLSGIPGSVGATPIQNVGAYGQEVSETIVAVHTIARADGTPRTFTNEEARFGYRHSIWKGDLAGQHIVTSVTFRLRVGGPPAVRYAELETALRDFGPAPSLADTRRVVLSLRRRKSMVYDTSDVNRRSAGSFFVNPIIGADTIERVRKRLRESVGPKAMPEFPQPDGSVKLAAAWLIEQAGFVKGTVDGSVGISTNHSLAIVNLGGAGATDVTRFASRIRRTVASRFGVVLRPEPELVGFSADERDELYGALD